MIRKYWRYRELHIEFDPRDIRIQPTGYSLAKTGTETSENQRRIASPKFNVDDDCDNGYDDI